jgi:hypothetical protein
MRWRVLVLALTSLVLLRGPASAQQRVPVGFNQDIPAEGFKSWSLFLVCDPAWFHPEQRDALKDLQVRYWYFGDTTGPEHAAVWFTEKADPTSALDIPRMVLYCRRFDLDPSKGPHIVVTTIHPDRWTPTDSRIVLAFNRRSANEIQEMLSILNKQIVHGRLSQQELDSERWWLTWAGVLESACRWLGKVEWGIDVKALSIKREGVC